MSAEPERPFVYRIDSSDTITDVNDAWVKFALDNEAASLTEARVTGRSLWDYVSGDEVRHLYRQLFEQVRSGRDITIPFRCDSPRLRRFHDMRMVRLQDAGVELQCRLLREEPHSSESVALLEPDTPRGGALIVMCSWCKKVETPQQGWLELDRAVEEMELFGSSPLPSISHSICPGCREELSSRF